MAKKACCVSFCVLGNCVEQQRIQYLPFIMGSLLPISVRSPCMRSLFFLSIGLISAIFASPAFCGPGSRTDEDMAKAMAQKDYESARKKIQTDDKAELDHCAKYQGHAVNACIIQAHGKRERAEAEAKATVDQAGQTAPLPDAKALGAAKGAIAKAKNDRKAANRNIADERNAAIAECSKLKGIERKACIKDVDARRAEALEFANAIYKKSVRNAKSLTPP